jgi:zinc protease
MDNSNKLIPVFKTPKFEKVEINENFDVYFINNKFSELISIRLSSNIGTADEFVKGEGYLTSKLLIAGNENQTFKEIFDETDFMGASLNQAISYDSLYLTFFSSKKFIKRGLEIIADCIQKPLFDENEIEKEKTRIESEIMLDLSDTNFLSQQILMKNFFINHPYGLSKKGKISDLKILNKSNCYSFHSRIMQSKKSLFIAGNFDRNETFEQIIQIFNFPNKNILEEKPNIIKKEGRSIYLFNKENSGQANLRIGKSATNHNDFNYPALQVVNVLFGGFFMSRLNNILREEKGNTYGIASLISILKQTNMLIIASTLKEESLGDSINTIIEQMDVLSNEKVEENELNRAKQFTLGSFLRNSETTQQQLNIISNLDNFKLESNFYDKYINSVGNLNLDDLFNAQIKYYKTEDLVISIVGDKKAILPQLKDFSNIYICNEYGEVIEKIN